jgi:hypothetical protein
MLSPISDEMKSRIGDQATGMSKPNRIPVRPALLILALAILLVPLLQSTASLRREPVDYAGMSRNIDILCSPEIKGRLAGSTGNREAMDYLIRELSSLGIAPAGEAGSFEQPFHIIMPELVSPPVFTIGLPAPSSPVTATDPTSQSTAGSGLPLQSFQLYEDYNVLTSMNGGGIDFYGEMVLLGTSLYQVDPAMVQGRIVVVEFGRITPELVDKVITLQQRFFPVRARSTR